MSDDSQAVMLARLDERTRALIESLADLKTAQLKGFDAMALALKEHALQDDDRFAHSDRRLKLLENWRTYMLGGMALGATLIAFLMWAVTTFWPTGNVVVEKRVETEVIQRPQEGKK